MITVKPPIESSESGSRSNGSSLSILMIAPQPFFRSRGTPFSVLHRIRALLLSGHSVDLVTYPFGEAVPLEGLNIIRAGRPPFVRDVPIGPSFTKVLLDIPLYLAARRQLKKKKYDLIHSHEEAAFFAVSLAAKYKIKHVYDMHSSLPQQLCNFGRFNYGPVRKLFERMERYVLDTCDGVITICTDLANTVDKYGVDIPHSMIENTADDTLVFPPQDVDVVETYSLQNKQIVLYTGTFETYQGLDLLVAAFKDVVARLPDAHLLMVGGRPEQVAATRRQVEELGIGKSVSFSGTVPSSAIPSYLSAADVIASPRSSGTNTPLKLYGYMRSGVPMVATDKYTHTQTLDPGIAHLVPATVSGMAEGILKLLNDREYATRLADEAMKKADKLYSDRVYLFRVSDFYSNVFRRVTRYSKTAGQCSTTTNA
jgi:glycosyltransferase involved in cell wall biosynthesis